VSNHFVTISPTHHVEGKAPASSNDAYEECRRKTADFIENFKDEIKAVVDRATHFDFDWHGVEKSRLFQTRLQNRRRDARNAADVDDDWKKDAEEKATRIWEWWRPV